MGDIGDDWREIREAQRAGKCPAGCSDWTQCKMLEECREAGVRCSLSRWQIPKEGQ